MKNEDGNPSQLGDVFDRQIRALHGLPDVLTTKATTVRAITALLNLAARAAASERSARGIVPFLKKSEG